MIGAQAGRAVAADLAGQAEHRSRVAVAPVEAAQQGLEHALTGLVVVLFDLLDDDLPLLREGGRGEGRTQRGRGDPRRSPARPRRPAPSRGRPSRCAVNALLSLPRASSMLARRDDRRAGCPRGSWLRTCPSGQRLEEARVPRAGARSRACRGARAEVPAPPTAAPPLRRRARDRPGSAMLARSPAPRS